MGRKETSYNPNEKWVRARTEETATIRTTAERFSSTGDLRNRRRRCITGAGAVSGAPARYRWAPAPYHAAPARYEGYSTCAGAGCQSAEAFLWCPRTARLGGEDGEFGQRREVQTNGGNGPRIDKTGVQRLRDGEDGSVKAGNLDARLSCRFCLM
jgi:hypothetical protein